MNRGHWNHSPSLIEATSCAVLVLALLLPAVGCNSFGNGKLVQQLQHENERLLTEFRAERQRREESERVSKSLEARLAESEKLLARQTQGSAASRLSSLQPGWNTSPSSGTPSSSSPSLGSADRIPNAGKTEEASAADDFRWQRRVN